MRIIFFIESLRSGGKERRLLELIQYLKFESNYEIMLVLTENEIVYKYIYDWDVPIYIIKRRWIKKDPTIFTRFYKIANKFKPDIVHTWGVMNTFYAIPTKILLNIPLITSMISNANFNIKPWSLEMLFFKSSCFFSNIILSNSNAGLLAYKIKSKKAKVIYNGINLNRFDCLFNNKEIKQKLKITTPYFIIMVASVNSNKHYDLFLDVAKEIIKKRNDITLVSVGGGNDFIRITNRIKTEKILNVLMLGLRSDIEEIVSASDLGVLFTYCEGFPNSVMEYMALKKPVIVSNVGGNNELVIDNYVGYLISNENIADICNKICHLIDDTAKSKYFGLNGYKMINQKYTIENMSLKFIDVYKSFNPRNN